MRTIKARYISYYFNIDRKNQSWKNRENKNKDTLDSEETGILVFFSLKSHHSSTIDCELQPAVCAAHSWEIIVYVTLFTWFIGNWKAHPGCYWTTTTTKSKPEMNFQKRENGRVYYIEIKSERWIFYQFLIKNWLGIK